MTESESIWATAVSISFSDLDAEKASEAREIWPAIAFSLSEQETNKELELRFDEPISKQIGFTAGAVLDAIDGARSWAVPVTWSYRRSGERLERKKSSLIYRPVETDEGTVAVDLVMVTSEAAPEGGKGQFDEDIELESELPIDPIPVSVEEQLSVLAEAGQETLAFYRKHGMYPSTVPGSLPELVEDVKSALESVKECSFPIFDTTLGTYEELLLENPTTSEVVHGPIRDEWLVNHALETDVLERLIDERIRPADPETARRWYKALLINEDEVMEQSLDVLATDPDQRAIGGLLLFVWGDDPQFAPQAVSILGTLLADHDAFEETREDRQHVLQQIENLSTRSDHPHVRAAAVEALGKVGHPCSRSALETAREDSDPDVRAAAEAALEQLNDRQNGG